ncbi:hypothetical protein ABZS78_07765, partial [Streptomyces decoyicus]
KEYADLVATDQVRELIDGYVERVNEGSPPPLRGTPDSRAEVTFPRPGPPHGNPPPVRPTTPWLRPDRAVSSAAGPTTT